MSRKTLEAVVLGGSVGFEPMLKVQGNLEKVALEAGADGCLPLPVHVRKVTDLLARIRQGNRPGGHTLDLERVQCEDPWRDNGGQG